MTTPVAPVAPVAAVAPDDLRSERRLLLAATWFVGSVFALGVSMQSMLVLGVGSLTVGGQSVHPFVEAGLRVGVNLVAVAIIAGLAGIGSLIDRPLALFVTLALGISAVAAAVRAVLQLLFGVHDISALGAILGDAAAVLPVGLMVLTVAGALVMLSRRAREAERERSLAAGRATEALAALQQEELRVRRDVADTLHGTMQHRLVVIEASLEGVAAEVAEQLPATGAGLGARLQEIGRDIDQLRERELRALSAALYPEALDRGIVAASRALLARIPASIPVRFDADGLAPGGTGVTAVHAGPPRGAPADTADGLDQGARLLLVRVAEEGVSNALRHGQAREIALSLRGTWERVTVEVRHVGHPPPAETVLSGLARLRSRLADLGGTLDLRAEPDGATLCATLPRTPH